MMCKVKIFAKTEVDLVHKVGVYAYCLYGYPDQVTDCKAFKNGIKTMTHADCMAFVNALWNLSRLAVADLLETLEIVTDSSKVVALIQEGKGEKHCEEAAKYWVEKLKPQFPRLKHIEIIKSDRKGTGPADNIIILKKLRELAQHELNRLKELSY